ncbi:MAG TPA: thioesterase family protein [Kofleriaceae bacterium]|nr:thioesterase family protein [Kofleriaceae bacterium]
MPPFVYRTPIRVSDVDHAGIVYYPRFFHYFHLAFEEFFVARLGARSYVELLDQQRVGFPAVASQCEYREALRFGDSIDIEMSVERLGGKSVTFRYRIFRIADERHPARTLCAEGTNTCAVVNLAEFRAIAIPEDVRGLFSELLEPG